MDRLLHYLRVLKEYARDYVLENTGLKILALLITAVLWLSVASRPVSQVTLRDVAIEFHNLPKSPLLVITKFEPVTARVYLEGSRDVLDTIRPSDVSVIADMSGVEPGTRVREVTVDLSRLPTTVKVRDWEPRSVRATIERVVESTDLPVVPNIVDKDRLPVGYEFTWTAHPATVRVVGPESEVNKLKEVSTETVSLAGKTEAFTKRVAIDIGSPNLSVSGGNSTVELTVVIGKSRLIERVPVTVFGAPPGKEPVPRYINVTVFGEGPAVDAMTADDVSVAIEYQGEPLKTTTFTPRVTISPRYMARVTVRSLEPETVRIK